MRLKLENFKNFLGSSEFLLNKGLNLVEAPNSSGKTSLIEALRIFASYEHISSNLINKEAEKARITIETDETYEILLTLDKKSGELHIKTSNLPESFSNLDSLSFITEDHFIMQAALNRNFLIIKDWLVNLTEFPYYQKLFELVTRQIDNYKVLKNKEQSDFFARKKQLLALRNNLSSRKDLLETAYQDLLDKSTDDESVRDTLKLEKEMSDDLSRLNKIVTDKITSIKVYINELTESKSSLEINQNRLKNVENKESEIPRIISINEEKIEELSKEISLVNKGIGRITQNLSHLTSQVEQIDSLLSKDQKECPTCFSKITREYLLEILKHKQKEKEEIEKVQILNFKEIDSLKESKQKIEKETRDTLVKFPKEKADLEKLISQISRKMRQIEKKLPELEEEEKKESKNLKELVVKYKQISKEAQHLKNQLSEKDEKLSETTERLKEIDYQIDEISKEIISIDIKSKELNRYDIFISKMLIIKSTINKKIEYIRQEIIDTLNDEISKITKLFDFNQIKEVFIDDDFNISITRTDNKRIYFADLSMFERKTIGVIIAFVLKKKLANDFPVFVIDEYLNSLDEEKDKVALNYLKDSDYYVILTKSTSEESSQKVLSQDNITHIKA